jgi:hypothetical protein
MTTTASMLRTAGTLALATAALAAPTPAFANWESIHEATPPNADARVRTH